MSNPHEVKTVKCAHCGAVHQEANHWFVILVSQGKFRCAPCLGFSARGDSGPQAGLVRRLHSAEQPVCGQQCAQKVFEKYLAREGIHRARHFPVQAHAAVR